MSAPTVSRLLRHASRTVARQHIHLCLPRTYVPRIAVQQAIGNPSKLFSTSRCAPAGLMPDTSEPQPPHNESAIPAARTLVATEISNEEYHEHADRFMDALNERAEQLQEEREDVEVEYSAGVLSLTFPPNGTYVINKQPPNKQIWLSSPISGPKRYDWVLVGEGHHEKEGGGSGDWIYLRDGSGLAELLRREVGLSVDLEGVEEDTRKPSVDPAE